MATNTLEKFNDYSNYDSDSDLDSDSDNEYITINSDDEHIDSDDEFIEFGYEEISDENSDFDSDDEFDKKSNELSLEDEINNVRDIDGPFTNETENLINQNKNEFLFKKKYANEKCAKLNGNCNNECYYCFYKSRRFIFNEILKFYKKNNIGIKDNKIRTGLFIKSLKGNSSVFKTNFCYINGSWNKKYTLVTNRQLISFALIFLFC